MDIDIHSLTGIDETGHPAASDGVGIAIGFDIKNAVVSAVHKKIVVVGQIQASRGNEICNFDMRDRIHADHLSFGCHRIHNDPVHAVSERFIHARLPIKEHIQHFCRCLIGILMLDNAVSALEKISPGILLRGHQHAIDFGIVVRLIPTHGLILKNQKEAPGQRFPGSHILDQPDIIFTQCFALFIFFLLQFFSDHGNVLVRISFSGDGFELQLHR